ncbi:MAG: hypothetical protein JSU01_11855 [Bacteroidetes bacterium]|nr:hypothetical protein [Bacteroidota bacterium]
MSLAVAWTDEAKATFDDTVLQIESKWGAKPTENFVRETQPFQSFVCREYTTGSYFKADIYVLRSSYLTYYYIILLG